jgi:hypothetical protein
VLSVKRYKTQRNAVTRWDKDCKNSPKNLVERTSVPCENLSGFYSLLLHTFKVKIVRGTNGKSGNNHNRLPGRLHSLLVIGVVEIFPDMVIKSSLMIGIII